MPGFLASIHYGTWVLPALLAIPLAGAALIRLAGRSPLPGQELRAAAWREVRVLAFATFAAEAVVALGLWWFVDPARAGYVARLDLPWIQDWGARFTIGVDGISAVMILLTCLLMPLAVAASWQVVTTKIRSYYSLLLILTSGVIGVFVSLDLLLFYVFWELMLIPMYFIIGIWGGTERLRASLRYFLVTMIGSLLMLVAIVVCWQASGGATFGLEALTRTLSLDLTYQRWLFAAFFLAFAIKSAVFPFHTWLPDAQHEAPTTTAVALSVKVGAYGIVRFAVPLFPAAALDDGIRAIVIGLAVVGIVYGALVALVQPDFKKLVSYSSISHVGFIVLGVFALTATSVQGAVLVMVNTGITSAAMMCILGMLHERRKTGMIANFGGIARVVPMLSAMLALVAMSGIALPGTNGFVGEFLVLAGAFAGFPVASILAATGVVLGAVYALWAIQRVIFNPLDNPENRRMKDLNRRELAVLSAFAVAILWIGIWPSPMLDRLGGPSRRFVMQVEQGARAAATLEAATP
ncbi:MAG: NADH-quinone oxidoreductase subunit M [Gemmatimonadetes bacterium]|nr:NADH-quinone oxidoreductase subunit M [Gemmatimonadota bacterium]